MIEPIGALAPIDRAVLRGDAPDVATLMLNKVLVHGNRALRIVEVEAYTADDPASHSYRGRTARNATMFGGPGLLYVYFTYGMHWCANVVCGPVDSGQAVLMRAGEPVAGTAEMRILRPRAQRVEDIGNGPAKLCQALGLDGRHDGSDLVRSASRAPDRCGLWLADDATPPPSTPAVGTRVGISRGTDRPWRFWVPETTCLSRRRGSG